MSGEAFHPCAVIPTYDNPDTVEAVVRGVRVHMPDVFVVDDGSGGRGRAAVEALTRDGLAIVHHRSRNGGKGAAVKDGFRLAAQGGFTHVLQVDADGQHDLSDIPILLEQARRNPDALVLGQPRYDDSAPTSRLIGRKITNFWTRFETGGSVVDPMCGFRVYPLRQALGAAARGNRMDFDIEITVRMVWLGVPVLTVPTAVRYLPASLGGVSHFRLVQDNLRISWLHTRLAITASWRRLRALLARR